MALQLSSADSTLQQPGQQPPCTSFTNTPAHLPIVALASAQSLQRPPSSSPTITPCQQFPASTAIASVPAIPEPATSPSSPTPGAPNVGVVYGQETTAPSVRTSQVWCLVRSVWKRLVALVMVVAAAITIYYAVHGDVASTKSLHYADKDWFMSRWTAKKDYCEFKRTYQNDTACDPGHPLMKCGINKEWMRRCRPDTEFFLQPLEVTYGIVALLFGAWLFQLPRPRFGGAPTSIRPFFSKTFSFCASFLGVFVFGTTFWDCYAPFLSRLGLELWNCLSPLLCHIRSIHWHIYPNWW
ncbi:hypothetical protein PMIN06_007395 [Paraphaeosphaeria minitans]